MEERILHSVEECDRLRKLGHGDDVTDFTKNTSLIYAAVWIYRAFRWKENNPDYFNYISRYLMAGTEGCLEIDLFRSYHHRMNHQVILMCYVLRRHN